MVRRYSNSHAKGQSCLSSSAVGVIGVVLVSVALAAAVHTHWQVLYDDTLVSFCYAQNLTEENGLTWNFAEPLTDEYSNLLTGLTITPFILLDFDLLFVARRLSFIALAFRLLVITFVGRRGFGSSIPGTLLASFGFIMMPSSLMLGQAGPQSITRQTLAAAATTVNFAIQA